ncbi:MAG: 3-isopropylmalate dehydratase small subunit [Blastocatellia bacterium]|nr:3-isopropylmalate dehydratase small subunit [Blastocatellia bacterium]MCS7157466.1 3-isopropylmalate dehydratase small subunit [Blastocatellia bacterium]MCX7752639.1 3-isopropylmalate dehydratase small subunit [Blastocatellia bacterium]MDW8168370.1 3-isopropylmalate dehydratase small subunit [Acidobacteriota bacterium]MDW8255566.1 3-isopropylmalate dehydratase small subunit [Acidobacteriota bacterium]
MTSAAIRQISGRGIPLPGDDIDTDRIIPGRFLRVVTFEGLEAHVFEDDRRQNPNHPFNQEKYRGASLLIVGRNFGCGSSREHAPQALMRWGIRGIIGESFAEIFFANCTAIGIPCVMVSPEEARWLRETVAERPELELHLSLETMVLRAGDRTIPVQMPEGTRRQFLEGTWNSTFVLLEAGEAIERTAAQLPYLTGF